VIGALLLAAGSGTRMRGKFSDKLLQPIGRSDAFSMSCTAFLLTPEIKSILIAYKDAKQQILLKTAIEQAIPLSLEGQNISLNWVQGGTQRQDSVQAGLVAFPDEVTHVLIHDCARPFIRPETISAIAQEIARDRAICVARPLKDTLRRRTETTDSSSTPCPTHTVERANHWLIETPQGAPRQWLLDGLNSAKKEKRDVTDDMAAVELLGHPVGMIEPDYPNPKITTPDDFSYAQFLAQS
jgi:2-C-methyl-D-erythritol 4-phosphate cytidylyltransferase